MRLDDVSHLMLLNLGPPFDDAELYSTFWDRVTEPVDVDEKYICRQEPHVSCSVN